MVPQNRSFLGIRPQRSPSSHDRTFGFSPECGSITIASAPHTILYTNFISMAILVTQLIFSLRQTKVCGAVVTIDYFHCHVRPTNRQHSSSGAVSAMSCSPTRL